MLRSGEPESSDPTGGAEKLMASCEEEPISEESIGEIGAGVDDTDEAADEADADDAGVDDGEADGTGAMMDEAKGTAGPDAIGSWSRRTPSTLKLRLMTPIVMVVMPTWPVKAGRSAGRCGRNSKDPKVIGSLRVDGSGAADEDEAEVVP